MEELRGPAVHAEDDSPAARAFAARHAATRGTAADPFNDMPVPRPRIWPKRPELVGQIVLPHTCEARQHGDNDGCICDLLGKPVKIVGIYDSGFVGTPTYHLEGTTRRIQEREFSEDTRGQEPGTVRGYILRNADGMYLGGAYAWTHKDDSLQGTVHDVSVVRAIKSGSGELASMPVTAYPAVQNLDGSGKRITGDPIPFDQLDP